PGKSDGTFDASQTINTANNQPLKAGMAAAPFAFDWDNDGKLDLIIGDIEGNVFFVRNEGTAEKPVYKQPTAGSFLFGRAKPNTGARITAAGKEVKVESDAGPTVADWNSDGTPDLIVGSGDGSVTLFLAQGREKSGAPVLTAAVTLLPASNQDGDNKTPWGIRTKPFVTDWNHDGHPDLLVGDFQNNNTGYHGYVWLFLGKPPASASR
ncbi:MAG TPA: VCBS repeat-containing protein, partial [Tepidisphaeraceae bacterium]